MVCPVFASNRQARWWCIERANRRSGGGWANGLFVCWWASERASAFARTRSPVHQALAGVLEDANFRACELSQQRGWRTRQRRDRRGHSTSATAIGFTSEAQVQKGGSAMGRDDERAGRAAIGGMAGELARQRQTKHRDVRH